MLDILSDILSSLGKNKLRTFLTGFSMTWGVLMLIILLGCGNGLKNSAVSNYRDQAQNLVQIFRGRTSMPYKGLQSGRSVFLDDRALEVIRRELPQVKVISAVRRVWGVNETYGSEYNASGRLTGITMEYLKVSTMDITAGRCINQLDLDECRKVIVLHTRNAKTLFKGANSIGKYVVVNNVPYKVIGIYNNSDRDQNPADIIPLSTLEKVYPSKWGYDNTTLSVEGINSIKDAEEFENTLRQVLSVPLQYDPADKSAVWMWNEAKSYLETMNIFNGISAFLWLIGIGTLIAGVVGISNIMLVTVKERTKEFGIRKALGARPRSIIALILTESLIITSLFGYIGMMLGIFTLEGLSMIFPGPDPNSTEFKPTVFMNPEVDLTVVAGAMVILIAAGLLAAYIPARKAVEIKPIEALHYE